MNHHRRTTQEEKIQSILDFLDRAKKTTVIHEEIVCERVSDLDDPHQQLHVYCKTPDCDRNETLNKTWLIHEYNDPTFPELRAIVQRFRCKWCGQRNMDYYQNYGIPMSTETYGQCPLEDR